VCPKSQANLGLLASNLLKETIFEGKELPLCLGCQHGKIDSYVEEKQKGNGFWPKD